MVTMIRCGKLIDGTGRPPMENTLLMVEGERISTIGRSDELKVPRESEVIDLSTSTVLPGMIDCHTHLLFHFGKDPFENYPQPELFQMLTCAHHVRWDIRCGLTTICNPSERSFRAVAVRHAIERGIIPGPRILTGVRGIRATHGHGKNAFGFDGVEELRKAIRENIEAGADLIKIYVTGSIGKDTALQCYLTRDEVQVCTDEAHNMELPIMAHANGGKGLRYCLETGVDLISHAAMMTEEDIELFLKHGNTLVATFSAIMHESTLVPGRPPEYVAGITKARENTRRIFPKALKSGMKFTVGSDARRGSFVLELETLVDLGLSPMEAVCACTRQAAEALGILDNAGTLEPGKWADIIAVPEDPLENISRLRDVNFVMKAGVHLDLSPL
jgi:imidazolonepropionase-like amidohydrolase